MRQLGILPDAHSARTFADYLLSQSIDTRLEESAGSWAVWVCDEDKLARAREEYQAFLREPAAERFHQAAREGQKRRVEETRAAELARRPRAAPQPALPQRRVVVLLIAASIAVTWMAASPEGSATVARSFFITEVKVLKNRVRWREGLPELRHGQFWRLITPIFIHANFWHLFFNMLWLIALGGQLEPRCGSWRFALLVVLLASLSNLCQYFFSTVALEGGQWVVESRPRFGGMSGVVFGLFGFVWMKTVYERNSGLYISPGNVVLMLFWLLLCMTGKVGPIANTAHFVGLVVGMLAGYTSAWWNGFGQPQPEPPGD